MERNKYATIKPSIFIFGIWCLEFGIWNLAFGVWRLAFSV